MFLGIVAQFQRLWEIVSPYLAGITLGGIISCFFYAFFSGSIKKFINKIQLGDIVNQTVDTSMDKIKNVAIQVELQPIIEKELDKVNQYCKEEIEKNFAITKNVCNQMISCFENLAKYFDNSIGVSQEVKDNLYNAIEEAKQISVVEKPQVIEVTPIIIDKKTKSNKAKSTNVR